jgi:hypothetical protein
MRQHSTRILYSSRDFLRFQLGENPHLTRPVPLHRRRGGLTWLDLGLAFALGVAVGSVLIWGWL